MKVLGSVCILSAGALAFFLRRRESAARMRTLRDLALSLREAEEEIRALQTPLPRLFSRLARGKCEAVSALFLAVSRALARGEQMEESWRNGVSALAVAKSAKEALFDLPSSIQTSEENACKGIILACERLQKTLDEETALRAEREKREFALCFSAAALLVILLI